jgi:hypothetical protein
LRRGTHALRPQPTNRQGGRPVPAVSGSQVLLEQDEHQQQDDEGKLDEPLLIQMDFRSLLPTHAG